MRSYPTAYCKPGQAHGGVGLVARPGQHAQLDRITCGRSGKTMSVSSTIDAELGHRAQCTSLSALRVLSQIKLLFATLFFLLGFSASAQSTPKFPPDFRDALALVPQDSASLAATIQPFSIPNLEEKGRRDIDFSFHDFIKAWLCCGIVHTEALEPSFRELEGQEVEWAISAKRKQGLRLRPGSDRILAFGIHPFESVSIAKFRKPIPGSLLKSLQANMVEIKTRSGVKAYRSSKETMFILAPTPNLLITVHTLAGDDSMLEDVVARWAAKSKGYIFEAYPGIWSKVSLQDTVWVIRRDEGLNQDSLGVKGLKLDWLLFSYDTKQARLGRFWGKLNESALIPEEISKMASENQGKDVHDIGKVRINLQDGYVSMIIESQLPNGGALAFPFFEAVGVLFII